MPPAQLTSGLLTDALRWRLVGADDLEHLADEDVVGPVDADVMNLVLAVAPLHNAVDDASRVGGQRSCRRLIRRRSADDGPRPPRPTPCPLNFRDVGVNASTIEGAAGAEPAGWQI